MRVLELHAPLKVIQRSKGRSATAAAAYRSASRIYDERTQQSNDYTKKHDVVHTAMLLPDNAPEWAHDRAKLWNAAEAKENRANSQTARELEISFPHEMNAEQRRLAGYQVAQILVERYGAAVDIAFHTPTKDGAVHNPHAHLLFTVRRFDPEQADGWAKKKDRVLDDRSKEKGAEHSRGALETLWLRERVATVMNDISAANELGVYTEHLSFEKRGLDREPTQHMGPIATDIERRDNASVIAEKNEEIRRDNARRERLEAERNVIDLTAERERRKLAKESADRQRDKAIRQSALDRRAEWYREVQQERTVLLRQQEIDFGTQETTLRAGLVQAHQITDKTGFVRFWHTVTGRRAAELERIEKLQIEYDRIQAEKAHQQQLFEQNRQVQLELLKSREIQEDLKRSQLSGQLIEVQAANDRRRQAQERLDAYEAQKAARYAHTDNKRAVEAPMAQKSQDVERSKVTAQERLEVFREKRAEERKQAHEQKTRDRGLDDGPSY